MMIVQLSRTAISGLNGGYRFYEKKEHGLGDYFKNTLLSEIEGLKVTAGIHRTIYGHQRMISRVFPFAIYYKLNVASVRVTAVIDCRRDPEWIRKQLDS